MILNERDYRITRARYDADPTPAVHQALMVYECLRDGAYPAISGVLEALGLLLIQIRIAKHLTQAELAARLDLHEQMIQRYEQTQYRSASLDRLIQVARALGVTIETRVDLVHEEA